eukprot:jgi/Mesvir1/6031/Mv00774-RA.1
MSRTPISNGSFDYPSDTPSGHEPRSHRTAPVAIFWDIEQCQVPPGVDVESVTGNIRAALRSYDITGSLVWFSAYGDFNLLPHRLRIGCQNTGVNLLDVPTSKREASDKAMLCDMFLFAVDNRPPATIFLISGDRDFSSALHKLSQRRYTVILAVPAPASNSLSSAATILLNWDQLARGTFQQLAPSPGGGASISGALVPSGPPPTTPAQGQGQGQGRPSSASPSSARGVKEGGLAQETPQQDKEPLQNGKAGHDDQTDLRDGSPLSDVARQVAHDADLARVRKQMSALLQRSASAGFLLSGLKHRFEAQYGFELDYKALGFASFKDLIKSMPEDLSLEGHGERARVYLSPHQARPGGAASGARGASLKWVPHVAATAAAADGSAGGTANVTPAGEGWRSVADSPANQDKGAADGSGAAKGGVGSPPGLGPWSTAPAGPQSVGAVSAAAAAAVEGAATHTATTGGSGGAGSGASPGGGVQQQQQDFAPLVNLINYLKASRDPGRSGPIPVTELAKLLAARFPDLLQKSKGGAGGLPGGSDGADAFSTPTSSPSRTLSGGKAGGNTLEYIKAAADKGLIQLSGDKWPFGCQVEIGETRQLAMLQRTEEGPTDRAVSDGGSLDGSPPKRALSNVSTSPALSSAWHTPSLSPPGVGGERGRSMAAHVARDGTSGSSPLPRPVPSSALVNLAHAILDRMRATNELCLLPVAVLEERVQRILEDGGRPSQITQLYAAAQADARAAGVDSSALAGAPADSTSPNRSRRNAPEEPPSSSTPSSSRPSEMSRAPTPAAIVRAALYSGALKHGGLGPLWHVCLPPGLATLMVAEESLRDDRMAPTETAVRKRLAECFASTSCSCGQYSEVNWAQIIQHAITSGKFRWVYPDKGTREDAKLASGGRGSTPGGALGASPNAKSKGSSRLLLPRDWEPWSWPDVHSHMDPYPKSMWADLHAWLEKCGKAPGGWEDGLGIGSTLVSGTSGVDSPSLAGSTTSSGGGGSVRDVFSGTGRYGAALVLKNRGPKSVRARARGELCHIVQLCMRRGWLGYRPNSTHVINRLASDSHSGAAGGHRSGSSGSMSAGRQVAMGSGDHHGLMRGDSGVLDSSPHMSAGSFGEGSEGSLVLRQGGKGPHTEGEGGRGERQYKSAMELSPPGSAGSPDAGLLGMMGMVGANRWGEQPQLNFSESALRSFLGGLPPLPGAEYGDISQQYRMHMMILAANQAAAAHAAALAQARPPASSLGMSPASHAGPLTPMPSPNVPPFASPAPGSRSMEPWSMTSADKGGADGGFGGAGAGVTPHPARRLSPDSWVTSPGGAPPLLATGSLPTGVPGGGGLVGRATTPTRPPMMRWPSMDAASTTGDGGMRQGLSVGDASSSSGGMAAPFLSMPAFFAGGSSNVAQVPLEEEGEALELGSYGHWGSGVDASSGGSGFGMRETRFGSLVVRHADVLSLSSSCNKPPLHHDLDPAEGDNMSEGDSDCERLLGSMPLDCDSEHLMGQGGGQGGGARPSISHAASRPPPPPRPPAPCSTGPPAARALAAATWHCLRTSCQGTARRRAGKGLVAAGGSGATATAT